MEYSFKATSDRRVSGSTPCCSYLADSNTYIRTPLIPIPWVKSPLRPQRDDLFSGSHPGSVVLKSPGYSRDPNSLGLNPNPIGG